MAHTLDPAGGVDMVSVDGEEFEVTPDDEHGLAWLTHLPCGQSRPTGTPGNVSAVAALKAEHKCGPDGSDWHLDHNPKELRA